MVQIRFKSLPKLINSMKKLGWIIDSFQFKYKNELYFVILKLYSENENRPTRYTQVKLEFIKASNISESIHATADFYEVHFTSVNEFVNFFGISSGNANRDLFIDFSDIFSKFIPSVKQEVNAKEIILKQFTVMTLEEMAKKITEKIFVRWRIVIKLLL